MAGFNTIVKQMIEMFSEQNISAKNDQNVSVKKKQSQSILSNINTFL